MTHKVAILIPTTSKNRDSWKTMKDTYLYKTIKSFLQSVSTNDANQYTFFLGYDIDDRIFSIEKQQAILNKFQKVFKQITITWISLSGIEKGHLTKMWNRLFRNAFNVGNDYFYQCGDDVQFVSPNWVDESIKKLYSNNQIGLTGPLDLGRLNINKDHSPGGEKFIQTQSFVSRKHMDIFGFYFPEEIRNWYCDDWITKVYYPNHFYQLKHYVINKGGSPRYEISGTLEKNDPVKVKCNELIHQGKDKLEKFINSNAL